MVAVKGPCYDAAVAAAVAADGDVAAAAAVVVVAAADTWEGCQRQCSAQENEM